MSEWFLGKMNGPPSKIGGGDMTVCDKVGLDVASTSNLLSCERGPSPLVDGTPGEGIYNS